MTLAEKLHKASDGRWWYAPLTLVTYWLFAVLVLWVTGSAINEGRVDHLWRSTRLLAGGARSITFVDRPLTFVSLILLFAGCSLALFLIGWIKFTRRRRTYLANAKYL